MADQKLLTFLMFAGKQNGKCEEAVHLYISLFPGSKILELERYSATEQLHAGTAAGHVKKTRFTLNASIQFLASDAGTAHPWAFTPAVSIFVQCDNEAELDRVFSKLSEHGSVQMPPENYGFSKKFAFVTDRYGVSWQLNLKA